jgi:hypothetical protein
LARFGAYWRIGYAARPAERGLIAQHLHCAQNTPDDEARCGRTVFGNEPGFATIFGSVTSSAPVIAIQACSDGRPAQRALAYRRRSRRGPHWAT